MTKHCGLVLPAAASFLLRGTSALFAGLHRSTCSLHSLPSEWLFHLPKAAHTEFVVPQGALQAACLLYPTALSLSSVACGYREASPQSLSVAAHWADLRDKPTVYQRCNFCVHILLCKCTNLETSFHTKAVQMLGAYRKENKKLAPLVLQVDVANGDSQ
jgi:hypothetical protein